MAAIPFLTNNMPRKEGEEMILEIVEPGTKKHKDPTWKDKAKAEENKARTTKTVPTDRKQDRHLT